MNTEKMKCFVDVVKYKSFTKAAQANYITQAAISQQISSIEDELGFKCFERAKSGLNLTDGGREFYNSSLQILNLYFQSISRARCVAHSLSGNISIGLWPGFDTRHIYAIIGQLYGLYPDIRIVIRTGSPVDFWHKIKAAKLAAAIVMPYDFVDMAVPNEILEPLYTGRYDLYVSEKNPLACLDCISIKQLREQKIIVVEESSIGIQTYSHTVIEQMQNRHLLKPAHIVANYETQQILVAANQGVMLLPDFCRPAGSKCMKRLQLRDYPETCTLSVAWNPSLASLGLRKFVDLFKRYFQEFQNN